MLSSYAPWICVGVPFCVAWPTLVVVWYWLFRTGRASVRLLAGSLGVGIAAFGGALWIWLQESWVAYITAFFALCAVVAVLSLRRTNPELLRRLKLRW